MASVTICNMMVNFVIAILPDYISRSDMVGDDGYVLNENDISLIVSIFSIA